MPVILFNRPVPAPIATAELMAGIFAPLADQPVETCAILYLDGQRRLVGMRHVVGRLNIIQLSPRTVAADALAFEARAAVMAHNHPSGDPSPSQADLVFTRQLVRGLEALGVSLGDHVILARGGMTSLRAKGLL